MSRSNRRTPRDPLAWFQARMPIAADQQRDIGIAYHASLSAMINGHGTEQAWCTVSCAVNLTLLLCEKGYCAGAIPTVKLAQDALMRARERAAKLGKWGLDGPGIQALRSTLLIQDEQISRCMRLHIKEAMNEVHRRVEEGEVLA